MFIYASVIDQDSNEFSFHLTDIAKSQISCASFLQLLNQSQIPWELHATSVPGLQYYCQDIVDPRSLGPGCVQVG